MTRVWLSFQALERAALKELGASGEVVCVDEHFFLVFAD